jgi:hypothetical protein
MASSVLYRYSLAAESEAVDGDLNARSLWAYLLDSPMVQLPQILILLLGCQVHDPRIIDLNSRELGEWFNMLDHDLTERWPSLRLRQVCHAFRIQARF